MNNGLTDFHCLARQFNEELQAPIPSSRLHEVVDSLLRALQRQQKHGEDTAPSAPGTAHPHHTMLEQMTEICYLLMLDEAVAISKLQQLLTEFSITDSTAQAGL